MLAAVQEGNVQKMVVLMRQDPGFEVNEVQDGNRRTLLHLACWESSKSPMIPLLLAHPDIDVNAKDRYGWTPFMVACGGYVSCVREMLKDSRVKVNEPTRMESLHSGGLFTRASLTSSSGGLGQGGKWILGNQGMSTTRMPLGRQRRNEGQKW